MNMPLNRGDLIGFEITELGFDGKLPKFKGMILNKPSQGRLDIMNKDRQQLDAYVKFESTIQGLAN